MSVFEHAAEPAGRGREGRRPGWWRAGAWILPVLLLGGCLHGGGSAGGGQEAASGGGGTTTPGGTGLAIPDYRGSLAAAVGGVGRVRVAVSDLDQLFAYFYVAFVLPSEILQSFCPLGGSLQVTTQDIDGSDALSAGDRVTLTYNDCGREIGGRSVTRNGTVQVTVTADPAGDGGPQAPLSGLRARAEVDLTDSAGDGSSTRVQGPVDLAFRAEPAGTPTRFIWSMDSPDGTRLDLTRTGTDGTLDMQLVSHIEIEWDTQGTADQGDDRIRYRGTGPDGTLARLFRPQDMEQVIRAQEGSLPEQGLNDAGPTSGELVLEQLQPRSWCVRVGFTGGDPQDPTVEARFDDGCDGSVEQSESFGLSTLF